jgi:hypothetical protein
LKIKETFEWLMDNKDKVLALLIAIFYLVDTIFFGEEGDWALVLLFLALPLISIFFSDSLDSSGAYAGQRFRKSEPGFLIAFAGWVLLLLPLLVGVLRLIFHWSAAPYLSFWQFPNALLFMKSLFH